MAKPSVGHGLPEPLTCSFLPSFHGEFPGQKSNLHVKAPLTLTLTHILGIICRFFFNPMGDCHATKKKKKKYSNT